MPLSIKLPPNNLDSELLRGNSEDYFIKRMKKMESDHLEAGSFVGELDEIDHQKERTARYSNIRRRKMDGFKQVIKA